MMDVILGDTNSLLTVSTIGHLDNGKFLVAITLVLVESGMFFDGMSRVCQGLKAMIVRRPKKYFN